MLKKIVSVNEAMKILYEMIDQGFRIPPEVLVAYEKDLKSLNV